MINNFDMYSSKIMYINTHVDSNKILPMENMQIEHAIV